MIPPAKNRFSASINWSPLIILILLLLAFFYFHLHTYFTLSALKTYQGSIQIWTNQHYILAVIIYLVVFTFTIACTIPTGTLLALLGGFLFGKIAIIYAIFSITLGGLILYFAIRTSIGVRVAAKSTGWIKKMELGFQENAFHYLLTLRLIPVFPCWISNIASGMLNVPVNTFILATVIGITPATAIYVLAGRSLDTLLSMQDKPIEKLILMPSIFFPLLGLAILSIFPVIYKYLRRHHLSK